MKRYSTMNFGASSVASMRDTLTVLPRNGGLGLSPLGTRPPEAPVHPPPLLGMAEDQPLERRVVCARRTRDRLVHVRHVDRRHRLLEAQHVRSIGVAPRRRR